MTEKNYKQKYHWILERDAYIFTSIILIVVGIVLQPFFGSFWSNIGISLIASGIVGILSLYILYVRRQFEEIAHKFYDWGFEDIFPDRSDQYVYKKLIDECRKNLDIQAETLSRFYSDFKEEIKILDYRGVNIRLLLLDPDSVICSMREREEESSERINLSEKIKSQTKEYYKLNLKNLKIKWYNCTPSINYFRVDDKAFFGSYFVGIVSRNSLTFLGRVKSKAVNPYTDHFNKVWEKYSREVPNEWQS